MPDERLARALRARVRRRILEELVKSGPLSVGEIAEKVGIAEYNASKHLKLLHLVFMLLLVFIKQKQQVVKR
jgi:DNA-binding transcriptional ArsR family regulator